MLFCVSTRTLAAKIDERLTQATKDDLVSYVVQYGEFTYQAGSWKYPRRVVCKVEKHSIHCSNSPIKICPFL